jgi:hypothetical protein
MNRVDRKLHNVINPKVLASVAEPVKDVVWGVVFHGTRSEVNPTFRYVLVSLRDNDETE